MENKKISKEYYKKEHAKLIVEFRTEDNPDRIRKVQRKYWKLIMEYHGIDSTRLLKEGIFYWDTKFEEEIGYLKEQHE